MLRDWIRRLKGLVRTYVHQIAFFIRCYWWDACILSAFIWGLLCIPITRKYAKGDKFEPISYLFHDIRASQIYFALSCNPPDCDTTIVVIDISECDRGEIAAAIQAVAVEKPAVMGLDIIFPRAASTDQYGDSVLKETCRKHKDRLVCAYRSEGNQHSYFLSDDTCFVEGAVDVNGGVYYDFKPYYKKDIPSFNYLVAREAQIDMPATVDSCLINYRWITCMKYHWKDDSDRWQEGKLCDKIVLIGDTADLRDYIDIPVRAPGATYQRSGILLNQQIISSYARHKVYKRVPLVLVLIISVILVWLYCATSCCRRYKEHEEKFSGFYIQIGYFILLLFVVLAYWVLLTMHYEFDLIWVLSGTSLAAFFTEAYYYIKENIIEKKHKV